MFIRRVKTRTTADGSCYYSYRLVESTRVANRVRQRTLLNLGSHFSVSREQWPELTQRIEQILRGQHGLLAPPSLELEQHAQSIADLLLHKYSQTELLAISGAQAEQNASGDTEQVVGGQDLHSVDLNSLEHSNGRTVGGEALALSALFETHLPERLASLGFNHNQVHAAMGNLVSRMLLPGSELSTHEWLQKQSGLGDLLNFEYEKQGLPALYRASDLLWAHHQEIEDYLYQQHLALFDIEECITLYDLTNTFLRGVGNTTTLLASDTPKSGVPIVPWLPWRWCWMAVASPGVAGYSRVMSANQPPCSR